MLIPQRIPPSLPCHSRLVALRLPTPLRCLLHLLFAESCPDIVPVDDIPPFVADALFFVEDVATTDNCSGVADVEIPGIDDGIGAAEVLLLPLSNDDEEASGIPPRELELLESFPVIVAATLATAVSCFLSPSPTPTPTPAPTTRSPPTMTSQHNLRSHQGDLTTEPLTRFVLPGAPLFPARAGVAAAWASVAASLSNTTARVVYGTERSKEEEVAWDLMRVAFMRSYEFGRER